MSTGHAEHPSALCDRFAEPPRAFSPVPLWRWSGDTVTAARLRSQLQRLAAGGIFNVVVMRGAEPWPCRRLPRPPHGPSP
jgi:hypothetical protein